MFLLSRAEKTNISPSAVCEGKKLPTAWVCQRLGSEHGTMWQCGERLEGPGGEW